MLLASYDGEWQAGRRHGYGVMEQPGSNSYRGGWAGGPRCPLTLCVCLCTALFEIH